MHALLQTASFGNLIRHTLLSRQVFLVVVAAASFLCEGREARAVGHSSVGNSTCATGDDRLQLWRQKWSAKGNPRFHKKEVHPSLKAYLSEKILDDFPAGGCRILVPLCGKSLDMSYLAKQRKVAEVVGVDGVRMAMEAFTRENPDLEVQPIQNGVGGSFEKWKGYSTTLLTGDFFDLDVDTAGGTFDAAWDRGALVAVDPSLREQYVDKLGELLSRPNGRILLSTYVRSNGDTKTGPPFSIDEGEVRQLFEKRPWVESVELLDVHSAFGRERWHMAIIRYLTVGNADEKIFLIKTK